MANKSGVGVGGHAPRVVLNHGVTERAGSSEEGKITQEKLIVLGGNGFPVDLDQRVDVVFLGLIETVNQVTSFSYIQGNANPHHGHKNQKGRVGNKFCAQSDSFQGVSV